MLPVIFYSAMGGLMLFVAILQFVDGGLPAGGIALYAATASFELAARSYKGGQNDA